MTLRDAIDEFKDARGPIPSWRIIGMLTEEAGEVQGAFNKWMDGNKGKPKTRDDVIEELVQLTGNCFLAADYYGLTIESIMLEAACFFREKAAQIRADGWTPDDQLELGQETNPDKR